MSRLTVKHLAERHGVSRALIYAWVAERRFPVYRLGATGRRGRILIDSRDFDAFLESLKVDAGRPDPPPLAPPVKLKHLRL